MMNQIPMKPDNVMFTDQQWEAIHRSGQDVLLSASAGSGKTRVLVERVIQNIKNGIDIDEMLIVTFTRAAAKEMQDRIFQDLQKEINRTADRDLRSRLVRQMTLLPQAQISTIHSFCSHVIQRFYYLIDIDPVYRLLTDTTEILLAKDRVWSDLREAFYTGDETEEFIALAGVFSSDRSDQNLTDLVQKVYDLAQAQLDPLEWIDQLDSLYDINISTFFDHVLWKNYLKPQILAITETNLALMDHSLNLVRDHEDLDSLADLLAEERSYHAAIEQAIEADQFDQARERAQLAQFSRWPTAKKGISEESLDLRDQVKEFRNMAKTSLKEDLKQGYLAFSLEKNMDMSAEMKTVLSRLKKVVAAYHHAYQDYKAERKLLDFNDLEHLTLAILNHRNDQDQYEAAGFYQSLFKEVLTDEYQDTNILQEHILRAISGHDNRFMVGDVKQSIYRFRMAEPQLFMSKYRAFQAGDEGVRINLQENFRSRSEVLDFVNLIFEQLMDEEVGELAYDESAQLVVGNQDFPESENQFNTEMLIYTKDQEEESSEHAQTGVINFSKTRHGEIALMGKRMKELINQSFEIYDKDLKSMRPVNYHDMVVLTRNKSDNFTIQMIFDQLDIPTFIPNTQNYFQTTEVSTMMSLLKIIDNPYQDIPLAAVLRSPIVGLDENDLAVIRISDLTSDYYTALQTYLKEKAPEHVQLQEKLQAFYDQLQEWRSLSRRSSLTDLIWNLYNDSHYLDYVGGMPGGAQRKANLHALYERAGQFEAVNFQGLFAFIRFIEKMQEQNEDLNEPFTQSTEEDRVRVMTIHNSKGLEFPLVFVLGLSTSINNSDYTEDVIFDKETGLASRYLDPVKRIKAPTLQYLALGHDIKRQSYSEEMRVLYVALTRAEQKLFILGSGTNQESLVARWQQAEITNQVVLPIDLRLRSSRIQDWLGFAVYRHSDFDYRDQPQSFLLDVFSHPASFTLTFYDRKKIWIELQAASKDRGSIKWWKDLEKGKAFQSSEDFDRAVALMNLDYPYPLATQTTSYQSVSEIKRVFDDINQENLLQLDASTPLGKSRYVIDELERPSFITETVVATPAEIGMATHLVLQNLDFSSQPDEIQVKKTIQNLVDQGQLADSVASRIDQEKLLTFLDSELAGRMVDHAQSLERELAFSLKLPADDIFAGINAGEDILIHGIVDGYFEEDQGLVVFDYKTDKLDRYGEGAAEAMLEKYRGQVNLYKLALENILQKPVKESYLVLLDKNITVEVYY